MKEVSFLLILTAFVSFGQNNSEDKFLSLEDALKQTSKTTKLDLANSDLIQLPNQILEFIELRELDLSENPNLNLELAFDKLSLLENLKVLYLTESKIDSIPLNIETLNGIEEIWLDSNELTEFPDGVKKIQTLKYLRLFDNKISRLNFNKSDLKNLEHIDLCYNNFTEFPIELSNLQSLKNVIMWVNEIKIIPDNIGRLSRLETLNLDYNKISIIPFEISKLNHLKVLSLKGNSLISESISPLFELTSLEKLDLGENKINVISSQIKNLKNLKNINLSENPLISIPKEFSELQKIEQMGLGELAMSDWAETFLILSKIESLRRIGLYRLKIKNIPDEISLLQQVRTFWMSFNSFNENERNKIRQNLPLAEISFD